MKAPHHRLRACAAGLLIGYAGAATALSETSAGIETALREFLAHHPAEALGLRWHDVDVEGVDEGLIEVYHEAALEPLWVTPEGPGARAAQILAALESAADHGLRPEDYGVDEIRAYWDSREPTDLALLDIALTSGLVGYANDVHEGRVAPREEHPKLFVHARDEWIAPLDVVERALAAETTAAWLESLAPGNHRYAALREQLKAHRDLAARGGWPTVDDGPTLHPGENSPRVVQLRERLAVTGDWSGAGGAGNVYDDPLVEAVKHFQRRHGLDADGVVGAGTLAELNVPVDRRIRTLEMNLERWRWVDHDLGERYLLVDIAGFTLESVRGREIVLEMPVIVGKHHHETPVFHDRIKYLEFNPYWNITPSIARHEMLPKLRQDPGYLGAHDIRLFSGWGADARPVDPHTIDWSRVSGQQMARYKLRQEPGPMNALGTVKFMFPNKYSVYLHDTPNHRLFDASERAFSHGCVRVSDPLGLALHVLDGAVPAWDDGRIGGVLETRKNTVVKLVEPLPVFLAYQTAWVDRDGRMRFNKDLYGRDARLEQALYQSAPAR